MRTFYLHPQPKIMRFLTLRSRMITWKGSQSLLKFLVFRRWSYKPLSGRKICHYIWLKTQYSHIEWTHVFADGFTEGEVREGGRERLHQTNRWKTGLPDYFNYIDKLPAIPHEAKTPSRSAKSPLNIVFFTDFRSLQQPPFIISQHIPPTMFPLSVDIWWIIVTVIHFSQCPFRYNSLLHIWSKFGIKKRKST